MASFACLPLSLAMAALVYSSRPPIWTGPPTCYSRVLQMAEEITQLVADVKADPETSSCTAHIPSLYVDVHNACIMDTIRGHMVMIGLLHERHCSSNQRVRHLRVKMRQFYIIMSQKCHGDLVFTSDDCAALEQGAQRP
ncbi:cytokine-like protein 1 [Denticeps clupeoides]|uniref:Cytokine-like protein 1 n=1 Tax=Denticeps clupeoides TaxID=299321 RepID=A0AAY4BSJ3_9TELE|nr:cytokine-like protein 1 [Denticeps clupeoides]